MAFWYGLLVWSSIIAFWNGLLLLHSGAAFCCHLLLWPSVVAFCYGLLLWPLVWPSGVAFFHLLLEMGSLLRGVSTRKDIPYGGQAGSTHPTGMLSC